jgi:hypothetical protein
MSTCAVQQNRAMPFFRGADSKDACKTAIVVCQSERPDKSTRRPYCVANHANRFVDKGSRTL